MNDGLPGRTRYVDAHCHIDLYPDPRAVMEEASRRGIAVVAVTNTPSVFEPMSRLASGFDLIFPALGLHPELARERESEAALIPRLISRTRFIGEIGLDGTARDARCTASQERVFEAILACSRIHGGKVLTIHSRRASRRVLELIGENFPGVVILHWFSGSVAEAKRAIERGWYFSVNPAMTASASGRKLIEALPRDRTLSESDGPFLKVGSRPSSPEDVVSVVRDLANLWRVEIEVARVATVENFRRCL